MNNKDIPLQTIEQDRLGVQSHVRALSNFIRDTEMPFTIAIQGEWGSGKTSFMRMLEEYLCSEKAPKRERFDSVWINTWTLFMESDYEDAIRKLILDILSQIGNNFERIKKKNIRDAHLERAREALRTTASVFLDYYRFDPSTSDKIIDFVLRELT